MRSDAPDLRRVLALETTGRAAVAAIAAGGRCLAVVRSERRGILPSDVAGPCLAEAGLAPADLDVIAVCIGPGSYTGARMGIAAALALGWAIERPVTGVSALEAIAFALRGNAERITALIDAREGHLYAGDYRVEGDEVVAAGPPRLLTPAAWLESAAAGSLLGGDGIALVEEGAVRAGAMVSLVRDVPVVAVAALGLRRPCVQPGAARAVLEPLYVDAEGVSRFRGRI